MQYTIDAGGKTIGRVATEAAALLMGKNSPEYRRNAVPKISVKIENASRARISEKKMATAYRRYSGYPGGLKEETRGGLIKRRGIGEVFKRAVKGMLPKNKLQAEMLKRLTIIG